MSEFKHEEAIELLNNLWISEKKCPICEYNDWALSPDLMYISSLKPGRVREGRALNIPIIIITCRKCGYSIFFNAIEMGLISPDLVRPGIRFREGRE